MGAKDKKFIDNNPPQCTAADLNSYVNEINNLIKGAGLSNLDDDLTQMRQALINVAMSGTVFDYSGEPNDITLTAKGGKTAPVAYIDGLRILFFANAPNDGAVNVNVANLGRVPIRDAQDKELVKGDIENFVEIVYSEAKKHFVLAIQAASGGGAIGPSKKQIFYPNEFILNEDFVLEAGRHYSMVGPLEVKGGAKLTLVGDAILKVI